MSAPIDPTRLTTAAQAVGADKPQLATTLAQSGLSDTQMHMVGSFANALTVNTVNSLALDSGAQTNYSGNEQDLLAGLGVPPANPKKPAGDDSRSWLQQAMDGLTHFASNTGDFLLHNPVTGAIEKIGNAIGNVAHLPFRLLSSGLDTGNDAEIDREMKADGYDPTSTTSRVAFYYSQGENVYHDLSHIRDTYDTEANTLADGRTMTDLIVQMQRDPEGFQKAWQSMDPNDPDTVKLGQMQKSADWAKAAEAIDTEHISPGRDIARVLTGFHTSNKAFHLISGVLDAAYDWYSDPTLILGKADKAIKAMDALGRVAEDAGFFERAANQAVSGSSWLSSRRAGLQNMTDQAGVEALLKTDPSGNAVTKVGKGWQSFLNDAKAFREADARAKDAALTAEKQAQAAAERAGIYRAMQNRYGQSLMPLFEEVNGNRVEALAKGAAKAAHEDPARPINVEIDPAADPLGDPYGVLADTARPQAGKIDGIANDNAGGHVIEKGAPIEDLKDLSDYLTSTNGLLRLHNGMAARRSLIMPGQLSLLSTRKVTSAFLQEKTAANSRTASQTAKKAMWDYRKPNQIIPMDEDGNPVLQAMVDGRTQDAVQAGDAQFDTLRRSALRSWQSARAKADRVSRRLTTLMPNVTHIDLTDANGSKLVEQVGRMYLNKGDAARLASNYAAAGATDIATRRSILKGVIEQSMHAAGLYKSADGKAFADRFLGDLDGPEGSLQQFGLGDTSKIVDATTRTEKQVALYPDQLSTKVLIPSFREMNFLAAKYAVGGWTRKVGIMQAHSLGQSSGADKLMAAIKLGWIATAAGGLRNALDEVANFAVNGMGREVLSARSAFTKATKDLRDQRRAYSKEYLQMRRKGITDDFQVGAGGPVSREFLNKRLGVQLGEAEKSHSDALAELGRAQKAQMKEEDLPNKLRRDVAAANERHAMAVEQNNKALQAHADAKAARDAQAPWTDEHRSVESLKGERITQADGSQLNQEHVDRLAKEMRAGGYKAPPLQREETDSGAILGDGHHRLAAAERAGLTHVPVRTYANTPEGRSAANRAMAESERAKAEGRQPNHPPFQPTTAGLSEEELAPLRQRAEETAAERAKAKQALNEAVRRRDNPTKALQELQQQHADRGILGVKEAQANVDAAHAELRRAQGLATAIQHRVPLVLRGAADTMNDVFIGTALGKAMSVFGKHYAVTPERVAIAQELVDNELTQTLREGVFQSHYADEGLRMGSDEYAMDLHRAGLRARKYQFQSIYKGWGEVEADGGSGLDAMAKTLQLRFANPNSPAHSWAQTVMSMIKHDPETGKVAMTRAEWDHVMEQATASVRARLEPDDPAYDGLRHFLNHAQVFRQTKDGAPVLNAAQLALAKDQYAERVSADLLHALAARGDGEVPHINRDLLESIFDGYHTGVGPPDRSWLANNLPKEDRPATAIGQLWGPYNPVHEPGAFPAGYTQMMTKAYNKLVTDQINAISRNPLMTALYMNARENTRGYVEHMIDAGFSEETANEVAKRVALRHAQDEAFKHVDNPYVASQFSMVNRNYATFVRAQEDWLRRWGRTVRDNPAMIRQAQLAIHGAESAGLVEKDDQGNLMFVYPGSGLMLNLFGKVAGIFGNGNPAKIPISGELTSQVMFLNPSLDNPIGLTATPLLSIPFKAITKMLGADHMLVASDLDTLANGQLGAGRHWWEQLLPSWANRIIGGVLSSDPGSSYGQAATQALANMEAAGVLDDPALQTPAGRARFQQQWQTATRNALITNTLFGAFAPAAPKATVGAASDHGAPLPDWSAHLEGLHSLRDEYRKAVAQLGLDKANAWWEKTHPGELVYTNEARTQVDTHSAQAPATIRAATWMQDNAGFVSTGPNGYGGKDGVAAFFIPQGKAGTTDGTYSDVAYRAQLEAGIRSYKSLDDYFDQIVLSRGTKQYFDAKDTYDQQRTDMVNSGDRAGVANLDAQWQVTKDEIEQNNPLLAEKLAAGAENNAARDTQISQLVQMVSDQAPSTVKALGGNRTGVVALLQAYNDYQQGVAGLNGRSSNAATKTRQALRATYDARVQELAGSTGAQFPDLADLARAVFRLPN